jgi:hypothetical protein
MRASITYSLAVLSFGPRTGWSFSTSSYSRISSTFSIAFVFSIDGFLNPVLDFIISKVAKVTVATPKTAQTVATTAVDAVDALLASLATGFYTI